MEPGFTLEVEGCVKGYHIYREKPGARVGEILSCERDLGNRYNSQAVAVVKPQSADRLSHVPRGFGSLFCAASATLQPVRGSGSQMTLRFI